MIAGGLLLAIALGGAVAGVRALLAWRRQPSNLLLFTVAALACAVLSAALAGLGGRVGPGRPLQEWWALPVLIGVFAFPLTLFTHATLSRRIGFAWARIDWGHGTLCLVAVALLLNGLREIPAMRLLEPACWQGVVWYQHAVPAAFACPGVAPAAAAVNLAPLGLLAAVAAWAGLGLGLRRQRPGYALAMLAAVLLMLAAPVAGPLAWFGGQVLAFAAIATVAASFADLLARGPDPDPAPGGEGPG